MLLNGNSVLQTFNTLSKTSIPTKHRLFIHEKWEPAVPDRPTVAIDLERTFQPSKKSLSYGVWYLLRGVVGYEFLIINSPNTLFASLV